MGAVKDEDGVAVHRGQGVAGERGDAGEVLQLPLTAPAFPSAQYPTGYSGSWLSSAAHARRGAPYCLPAP